MSERLTNDQWKKGYQGIALRWLEEIVENIAAFGRVNCYIASVLISFQSFPFLSIVSLLMCDHTSATWRGSRPTGSPETQHRNSNTDMATIDLILLFSWSTQKKFPKWLVGWLEQQHFYCTQIFKGQVHPKKIPVLPECHKTLVCFLELDASISASDLWW